jgi:hypothetical protein
MIFQANDVKLKIYDKLGRGRDLQTECKTRSYEVQWDAAGYASRYVHKLQSADLLKQEMVLIK